MSLYIIFGELMELAENTGLLLKAFRFSADKHSTQRRKDGAKSPYINHPIEVVQLLWEVGGVRDVNVLLAAILHDTVEDTDTRPEESATALARKCCRSFWKSPMTKTYPSRNANACKSRPRRINRMAPN
jgi:(p)ppGpp synthase/HD superfamily hydrolase